MSNRPGTSRTLHRSALRQRGSVYVIVLAAGMLLVTIGVGSVLATRAKHRDARLNMDAAQARQNARAGIELATFYFRADPNWRTTLTNGNIITGYAVPGGTVDLDITDPLDGNLADDSTEEVLIVSTGYAGMARYKLGVRIAPRVEPGISALASAATSGGNVTVSTGRTVTADGPISSNGNFSIGLLAGAYAVLEVSGSYSNLGLLTAPPYVTTGVAQKQMPDAAAVIAYYNAIATPIALSSIPNGGPGKRIEKVLISPEINPFGSGVKNASGVYKIDCAGTSIEIKNCRVYGTLLIISAGANSIISDSIVWQPARADMPAMIVNGNMRFDAKNTLDEGSTNYNPAHTPYNGGWNTNSSDKFATIVEGLCYITGTASFTEETPFKGAIIAGALSFQDDTVITHDPTLYTSPPIGFTVPASVRNMQFVPGSWQRYVD